MARFRATIQGNRGEASRLGHEGIYATVNGWNMGIEVAGYINDAGANEFKVYLTGGSHGDRESEIVFQINEAGYRVLQTVKEEEVRRNEARDTRQGS